MDDVPNYDRAPELSWLTYLIQNRRRLQAMFRARERRDPERVLAEYRRARLRTWESAKAAPPRNVHDLILLKFADDGKEPCLVDGRIILLNGPDYYRHKFSQIGRILAPHLSAGTRLAEFGCGYGINLFYLNSVHPQAAYAGFDFVDEGLEHARFINSVLGTAIAFERLDMARPDRRIDADVILTHYAMEQVKYDTRRVLDYFRSLRPRAVVHIEPVYEFFKWYSIGGRDFFSRLYIRSKDYQDRLYRTVRRMEREGAAKILEARRLGYSSTPLHEGGLIVWEPRGD